MSTKVLAKDLKIGDSVDFEFKPIQNWSHQKGKLKGLIHRLLNQTVGNEVYKYVEVYTDKGITGAYLALTDEVIKDIIPKEEAEFLMARNTIRNLPRVIDQQGSDPEIFVVNKDGIVIPSFKFLGSKKEPNIIPENRQTMFWDGYQAEFNLPAQSCLDSTMYHFWYGLKHLNKLAKEYDKDARLTIIPIMDIPPHMLREDKDEHVEFGCMPSKNAYGMKGRSEDGRNVPFRSAGGHIHLQLRPEQKKRVEEYVKALDAILGVACVGLFGAFDDPRRRELYGLAGEYRTPSHGLEYRPLSNVWMCHPTITYIVFEMARKIISLVDAGMFKYWKADEKDTIAAINDCNMPLACELIKQNEQMFRDLLMSFCYQDKDKVNAVYNMFMTGVENYVDEVDNVEKNWRLTDGQCTTGRDRIVDMNNKPNFKKLLEIKF
jgi:hypothetical protein